MPDELIVIASFPNAAEAEIARAALAREGLQSCLADEGLVTNFWLLGNAVGYVVIRRVKTSIRSAGLTSAVVKVVGG